MGAGSGDAVFSVLRQALKARGLTYADLAAALQLSEPTIKRLFAERDCKYSRLVRICQVLGLAVADVLDVAQRQADSVALLPEFVEQALAQSPSLFWFYMLLRDDISVKDIAESYKLSETDAYLYCRDLEKLGLLRLGLDDRIEHLSTQAIRFTAGGALHELYTRVNLAFVSRVIDRSITAPKAFISVSRKMKPESANVISNEIDKLMSTIRTLARQDRLTASSEELVAYKWSMAADKARFRSLMEITPYVRSKID